MGTAIRTKPRTAEKPILMTIPVHGLSVSAAVYTQAITWLADKGGGGVGSVEFLKHSEGVCLLSSLAGVGQERVAEDVIRHRRYGL